MTEKQRLEEQLHLWRQLRYGRHNPKEHERQRQIAKLEARLRELR